MSQRARERTPSMSNDVRFEQGCEFLPVRAPNSLHAGKDKTIHGRYLNTACTSTELPKSLHYAIHAAATPAENSVHRYHFLYLASQTSKITNSFECEGDIFSSEATIKEGVCQGLRRNSQSG